MQIHKDSHLDHGLTEPQVAFLLERFKDRASFFIETVELPPELGQVACGLYGPSMGDQPISEDAVELVTRGDRAYKSRCIVAQPRPTRQVTVIAGEHDGLPCVLYTAFGGPQAPQEVGELELAWEAAAAEQPRTEDACRRMDALRAKLEVSRPFWRVHALARPA